MLSGGQPSGYWTRGSPSQAKAAGFKTILVYCVGPPDRDPRPRCWHWSEVPLDVLPDWDWYDICAHLKCTKCGSIGWVDRLPNSAIIRLRHSAMAEP
jgi:hypothetical protein